MRTIDVDVWRGMMGAIIHVLKKKIHYIVPAAVEAELFKHIGRTWHQFSVWLDRRIGYFARCLLWKHTKTVPSQIMFFPFSHSVGCNLKYISDELIRRQAPVDIYWSVSDPKTQIDVCEIASKDIEVSWRVQKLVRGEKTAGKSLAYWLNLANKIARENGVSVSDIPNTNTDFSGIEMQKGDLSVDDIIGRNETIIAHLINDASAEKAYELQSHETAVREYETKISFRYSRMKESSMEEMQLHGDVYKEQLGSGTIYTEEILNKLREDFVSVQRFGRNATDDIYADGAYAVVRNIFGKRAVIDYVEAPSLHELVNALKIQKLQTYVENHVHFVKTNSYAYFKAAASSKVLVTNSLLGDKFYPFPTNKNQIVVQTWHGSLGIKRFDPAHYNTNVTWPIAAKRSGQLTTHIISNSDFEDAVYRETFWQKTPILKYGHARNDIFFPQSEGIRKYLKAKFCRSRNLNEKTHFALYAPTFRDTHNFEVYNLDAVQTVRALEERFGGVWKLLVRYHDNDKEEEGEKNTVKSPDVIDVSKDPDIQSLLAFTDCGITDYSSWIYDYLLLRKPGFIFAMDQNEYDNERGFYFRLEDTPFPVAVDSDELEEAILAFDDVLYQRKVTEFLDDKGCIDDGKASIRIADQIERWCETAGRGI